MSGVRKVDERGGRWDVMRRKRTQEVDEKGTGDKRIKERK